MQSHKTLHIIAYILLIIGGLNWLLLGVFSWEVSVIFGGSSSFLSRGLFILVGLAAVYELVTHKQACTHCLEDRPSSPDNTSTDSTADDKVV